VSSRWYSAGSSCIGVAVRMREAMAPPADRRGATGPVYRGLG